MDAYTTDEFLPITWYLPGYPGNIPEASARAGSQFYNVTGAPTAWFDGWENMVGGLPSGTMFSYYNPIVSSHLGVTSPLEITATYAQDGYDVTLDVHIEVTSLLGPGSDRRVHFIVCEDGGNGGNVNMSRQSLTYEPFTIAIPGHSVDIQRTTTLDPAWTLPINFIVFVQNHDGNFDVLQADLATEGWAGDTMAVNFACTPDTGTLPFNTSMWVTMENLTPFSRRISGSITAQIANGNQYTNWRAGYTNLEPAETYAITWGQGLPAQGTLVGENVFTLFGYDVTPAPYNQPPYAPDGDSDSSACTITASLP